MSIFSTTLGEYVKLLKQCVCVRMGGYWWEEAYSFIQQNLWNKTAPGTVLNTEVLETEQDTHQAQNLARQIHSANTIVLRAMQKNL